MFLGLVGVPAAEISYAAFRQAVQLGGTYAATLAAAEATAVAGLATSAAAVVGAGVSGILIGQAILKGLERPDTPLPVRQYYKVAGGQGQVAVTFQFELTNGQQGPQTVVVDAPFVGVLAERPDPERTNYFLLSPTTGVKTGLLLAGDASIVTAPYIISATKVSNGQPAEALKIPTYPPTPLRTPVKVPTTIPIAPGIPDFPITPEIVPYTPQPLDKPDEEKVPGIIVQIPETGQQIVFTPTGVRISNYSTPATAPFEVPSPPPPPTDKKVAEPPCPCPEGDTAEILCRIKALQDGLLDDGYDYTSTVYALGEGGNIDNLEEEIYAVTVNVADSNQPIKKQRASGSSSEVWYAGWVTWRRDGTDSERTPINYKLSSYYPPLQATGFGVSIAYGGTCVVTVVTRVKRDYADLC